MRNLKIVFLLTLIPLKFAIAEIAQPVPAPLNCNGTEQVTLFRCVCRLNVNTASDRGSVSIPLYNNGSSTLFSASDISGQSCEGSLQADACRPGLSGRAVGRYSCVAGTTTETGGFDIRW